MAKAKAGDWWVINANSLTPHPLYWTGKIWKDGRPCLSFAPNDAAQFETREQADFNHKMYGFPAHWVIEDHGWVP